MDGCQLTLNAHRPSEKQLDPFLFLFVLVFVCSCFYLFLFLQQIMKDRWINAGFEEDELKPYTEPELDITDQKRIGKKKDWCCW